MTLEALPPTGPQKPGKVQAIAILTLASGITNILWPLFLILMYLVFVLATFGIGLIFCLVVPLVILPMVLGIFEMIYAAKLLPTPIKPVKPSQPIAVMEIICVLTGNMIPVAAGIVALILYGDPEVKAYFDQYAPLPAAVPPAPEPVKAEPARAPVLPKTESPVKVPETTVPVPVEPPATMIAMRPVTPPAVEPEQPKPVKAPAKAKPAAPKTTRTATKPKAGKPAQGPKSKAAPSKAKAKPARPKTKKPAS
jgi:hypothetical protein